MIAPIANRSLVIITNVHGSKGLSIYAKSQAIICLCFDLLLRRLLSA